MSEENETPEAEELLFYDGGIKLGNSRWGEYVDASKRVKTKNFIAEIERKLAHDEPVYVQILDDRRIGSVGRLSKVTFDYRPASTTNSWYGVNKDYLYIRDIEVVWDGRKNKCSPYANEIEVLPDWPAEEGTIWNWTKGATKESEPAVIAYDHLGQQLEVGQFVCFVHRKYGVTSMKFGNVTRFTKKGGVFVKTLKLRDDDGKSEELRAHDMDDVVICNDKLMSRLMMARLSAD